MFVPNIWVFTLYSGSLWVYAGLAVWQRKGWQSLFTLKHRRTTSFKPVLPMKLTWNSSRCGYDGSNTSRHSWTYIICSAAKRMWRCSRTGPDTLPLLCGPQGEFGSVTISSLSRNTARTWRFPKTNTLRCQPRIRAMALPCCGQENRARTPAVILLFALCTNKSFWCILMLPWAPDKSFHTGEKRKCLRQFLTLPVVCYTWNSAGTTLNLLIVLNCLVRVHLYASGVEISAKSASFRQRFWAASKSVSPIGVTGRSPLSLHPQGAQVWFPKPMAAAFLGSNRTQSNGYQWITDTCWTSSAW